MSFLMRLKVYIMTYIAILHITIIRKYKIGNRVPEICSKLNLEIIIPILTTESRKIETNDHKVKLQCLVLPWGKGVHHKPLKQFTILPVNILASYSVGELKKAIYGEKPKAFTDFSVDELNLGLVSIFCNEIITLGTDPEAYVKIRLLEKRRLVPIENVSEIFPQDNPPAPKHVLYMFLLDFLMTKALMTH